MPCNDTISPRDRERLLAELRECREALADNAACLRALRRLGPPHVPFGAPETAALPGKGQSR